MLEACCYANISKSSYYDWIKDNAEFSDEIEVSKNFLTLRARQNVYNFIDANDIKVSMWYLERKVKDEFNPKYLENVQEDSQIEYNPL